MQYNQQKQKTKKKTRVCHSGQKQVTQEGLRAAHGRLHRVGGQAGGVEVLGCCSVHSSSTLRAACFYVSFLLFFVSFMLLFVPFTFRLRFVSFVTSFFFFSFLTVLLFTLPNILAVEI